MLAVFTEQIHTVVVIVGETAVLDNSVAFEAETVCTKVISGAINIDPDQSVVIRSIVITHTGSGFIPNTIQQLTIFELVVQEDICAQLMADNTLCSLLGAAAEVVPLIINHLPALGQVTGNQAIPILASLNQTAAGHAFAASAAFQVIVFGILADAHIAVVESFNRLTPVYDRTAVLAVGTAGITCILASSGLVFQCNNGVGMVNIAIRNICTNHSSSHGLGAADFVHLTSNSLNITIQNSVVDGYSGLVCGSGLRLFSHVVKTIPGPNSNRNAQQGLLTGQCAIVLTGKDNGNCVIHSMDIASYSIGSYSGALVIQTDPINLEAGSNDHVLQFPGICGVQLDGCFHHCHRFRCSGIDVYIVDGVSLGNIAQVIVAGQFNQCCLFTYHGDFIGQLSTVFPVILNFESHAVLAIGQFHIGLGCHGGLAGLGLYFVTVDVNLSGIQIQTGNFTACSRFCNCCGKGNRLAIDDHTVSQCNALISSCVGSVGDHRCITVFHSCAVV